MESAVAIETRTHTNRLLVSMLESADVRQERAASRTEAIDTAVANQTCTDEWGARAKANTLNHLQQQGT